MKKYLLFSTVFLALGASSIAKADTDKNDLISTKNKISQIKSDLETNKNKLSELEKTKENIDKSIEDNSTDLSNSKIEDKRKKVITELTIRKEQDISKHVSKEKDISEFENPFSDYTQINNIKITKNIKELKHLDNEELKNIIVNNGTSTKQSIENSINDTKNKIAELEKKLNDSQAHLDNLEKETKITEVTTTENNKDDSTPYTLNASSDNVSSDQALFDKANSITKASDGLTLNTSRMKAFLSEKFNIADVGGYRAGDDDGTGHGHGTGMSLDFMVDKKTGDELAAYLVKNFDSLNVYYIIWQQRFYMPISNIYGPANTWNLMPDRGGTTANHYDHVHVSFKS